MDYKLLYVRAKNETFPFSFLGKQIGYDQWHLISLDHHAAYLIRDYSRTLVEIKDGYIKTQDNIIDVDYVVEMNDNVKPKAINTLIDFIGLGNDNTRIIKKAFLKEYIKENIK